MLMGNVIQAALCFLLNVFPIANLWYVNVICSRHGWIQIQTERARVRELRRMKAKLGIRVRGKV